MTTPNINPREHIELLQTDVPGLDDVLGGGLPRYTLALIAGAPGTGKTTLAQQMMFQLATPEDPALHFTMLGEPPIKMLRYQQQFEFFDPTKVGTSVHYRNLSEQVLSRDLEAVLEAIDTEVRELGPSIVVVDSFRTFIQAADTDGRQSMVLQGFLQRLALRLTTSEVTSFLVGEYVNPESQDDPIFTIADAILWLHQSTVRNSIVRKLQVVKLRGQRPVPGLHTTRINEQGIQVFPRIIQSLPPPRLEPEQRVRTGITKLDEMLGGGVPALSSTLIAGPSGTGKSTLGTQFIAAGLEHQQPGVMAFFEGQPDEYLARARARTPSLEEMQRRETLSLIYLRPLDLSVDEALLEIQSAVKRIGARRLLIDSLSAFELALAPTFREDFRESLFRMIGALTNSGVTVMMTAEVSLTFTDLRLTANLVSFLTDNIILQRYVEMDGGLRKVMSVVKMRRSAHSQELYRYEVTEGGIEIGEQLDQYQGIITGVAEPRHRAKAAADRRPAEDR